MGLGRLHGVVKTIYSLPAWLTSPNCLQLKCFPSKQYPKSIREIPSINGPEVGVLKPRDETASILEKPPFGLLKDA